MQLIDFRFEHLELFDWRENERGVYDTGSDFTRRLCAAADDPALFEAYTAVHDGRILVVGGIFKFSEKTGGAWTIFSRHADAYPVASAKLVRRMFNGMIADKGLHRVVTWNLVTAAAHHKWCKWLGFELEGPARKFDDQGRDYMQYARVI
jgi:hypothetical protein